MKTLLLVRHAKSSWDVSTITDFERPLNERGKKDAPIMAQRMVQRKINIDAFVTSPAKRAKKTAEIFGSAYKKNKDELVLVSALYHATPTVFKTVIEQLDNDYAAVALFSHNTGITEFVNELVENVVIDNMPTCSVFAVTAPVDKWKDFTKAKKELLFFDYPGAIV